MKILPPVSIKALRLLPSGWDVLAAILVVGFLVAFVGMMAILQINAEMREPVQGENGGYQTEKLAGFVNRATLPVQWAVDGFVNLLGIITMIILFGVEQVANYYHQHPFPFLVAALVLYLVWLGFTIFDIVSDELLSDDNVKRISWSLVTFGTWASIVFVVGYVLTHWSSFGGWKR